MHKRRLGGSELSPRTVGVIKWLVQNNVSVRELAQQYGMAPESIRRIARGDTWHWVQPIAPDSLAPASDEASPPEYVEPTAELAAGQAMLSQLLQSERMVGTEKARAYGAENLRFTGPSSEAEHGPNNGDNTGDSND